VWLSAKYHRVFNKFLKSVFQTKDHQTLNPEPWTLIIPCPWSLKPEAWGLKPEALPFFIMDDQQDILEVKADYF
jgi:hypothetical protein